MRRLLILIALLLLLAPATAQAASELATGPDRLLEPRLAGDAVVVEESSLFRSGGGALLALRSGAPPARMLSGTGMPDLIFSHDASAQRVVAWRTIFGGLAELLSGPLGGPLSLAESCDSGLEGAPPVAVAGETAVWSGAACERNALRIDGPGRSEVVDPGGYVTAVAAAGRYAAWLATSLDENRFLRTYATLYDMDARAVLWRVQQAPGEGLAVQDDGTVVTSERVERDDRCDAFLRRVTVRTPTDASGRQLRQRACADELALAGGRVALVRLRDDGRRELVLVGLDDERAQPLTEVDPDAFNFGFDWDGARVAWGVTRCLDNAVLVRDAADTGPAVEAPPCVVRVGSPRLSRDRRGRLLLRIACPNGCLAPHGFGVRVASPSWLRLRRPSHFRLPPGGSRTLRMVLTPRQRARILEEGRIGVRLDVQGQNFLLRLRRTLRAR